MAFQRLVTYPTAPQPTSHNRRTAIPSICFVLRLISLSNLFPQSFFHPHSSVSRNIRPSLQTASVSSPLLRPRVQQQQKQQE